jgi:hypothetical protein
MSNKIKPHYVVAISRGMDLGVLTKGGINPKAVIIYVRSDFRNNI